MRVVSLNCSNTEIVCALGCAERLVGVDDDSDWPVDVVARLPKVGRDLDIDISKVAALEPDLVLASITVPGHEEVVAGLARAGLRHHAPETQQLADVYQDIRDIAALLDVPDRAATVIAQMRAAIEAPPELTGLAPDERPSVLVQWWPKPVIAPGRRSWVHDLLEHAGARNALGDRDVKSTPLTDDEVAALDPDLIVISWCGVPSAKYRTDVVTGNPRFATLRAVRTARVHPIPEAYLGRPGPRLTEGTRALRPLLASDPYRG
ncbi:MAG: ABC transporter substrate-binding protein [Planctomycetes bacterium]|nr:ABC transporter substrate-binding protein [Planctomycetota bacterium]